MKLVHSFIEIKGGSEEGSDHFGFFVCSLSLHFCKRLFPGLQPTTSLSQGNNITTAPGLPFSFFYQDDTFFYPTDMNQHV
jgi:hypothetical protein